MPLLKNEHGVALITSLMLTLITLAMVMVLMSYVLQSTKATGASKQYKNTLEASYGAAELLVKDIIPSFFNYTGASSAGSVAALKSKYSTISLDFASGNACLSQKLNNLTGDWTSSVCGVNRGTANPKVLPDFTFVLKSTLTGFSSQPGYQIYAKIIDTAVVGNTAKSSVDYSTRNPGGDRDDGSPQPIPSIYTIDITGERQNSPLEKTMLEVLYSY